MRRNTVDDVLGRVVPGASDECWEWPGARLQRGYGTASIDGRTVLVHRVVAERHVGQVAGRVVRHTCDNPPCCNPRHLLIGSQADNMRDCVERGRAARPRGQSAPAVKLTDDQVRAVRDMLGTRTQRQIAREFGVSAATICRIATGASWWYLP